MFSFYVIVQPAAATATKTATPAAPATYKPAVPAAAAATAAKPPVYAAAAPDTSAPERKYSYDYTSPFSRSV